MPDLLPDTLPCAVRADALPWASPSQTVRRAGVAAGTGLAPTTGIAPGREGLVQPWHRRHLATLQNDRAYFTGGTRAEAGLIGRGQTPRPGQACVCRSGHAHAATEQAPRAGGAAGPPR